MSEAKGDAAIERAERDDSLLLVYQPIHETATQRVWAAEALLRQRRQNGEIREAALIAETAEKRGHTEDLFRLDSWVVRQAYSDLARWQREGAPSVRLNVNLSPRELEVHGLRERLVSLLTSSRVDETTVNLEITETVYIHGPEAAAPLLRQVTDAGIHLWLDDFGSGHSSLEHLLYFPVEGLKIPGTYISRIVDEPEARVITLALIRMAQDLSLKVVAEGVETEQQLRILADAGCDFIQGFLFSRPMTIDAVIELIRRQTP